MKRAVMLFSMIVFSILFLPNIKATAATQGYEKIDVHLYDATYDSRTKIAGVYFWYEWDEDYNTTLYVSNSPTANDGIALSDLINYSQWAGINDAWTNGTYIYYTKGTYLKEFEGKVTLYRMTISTQKITTIGSFNAKYHTDTTGGYYGILGIYSNKVYIGMNLNRIYVIDPQNVSNKKIVPQKFLSNVNLEENGDLASYWQGYNGAGYRIYSNVPSGPLSLYNGRYLLYSSNHKLYAYDLKSGTKTKLASDCYGWHVYEQTSKYVYIRLWHYVVEDGNIKENERFYRLAQSNLKLKKIVELDFNYDWDSELATILKYNGDVIVYCDHSDYTYYRVNEDGTKDKLTMEEVYDKYW